MSKKKQNIQSKPAGSASYVRSGGSKSFAVTADLNEPIAEERPVPVFLIVLSLLLLFYASLYLMEHGGDGSNKLQNGGAFPAIVYDPYATFSEVQTHNPIDPAQIGKIEGAKVFNQVCVACHQSTGQGLAGQFPPLAGSEWVLEEGPNRTIRLVLNGLTGPIDVKGAPFNNTMPPWKEVLTDDQIANVLTYVRSEWGNKAPAVTSAQVKKIRALEAGKGDNWTAPDLLKTSAKD